ncbi:MAG: hypothetical protein EHM80_05760, partial [Nitrospiraceae bacterium]
MSSTSQSRNRFQEQKIGQASIKLPTDAAKRATLRTKLTRERTLLMASWNLSLTTTDDSEPSSDLADQAATDLDQDLAIQVKVRTIARLRAIERALELMRTSRYGRCRSC